MGLSVTISLDVPPLDDIDVWFANAAAWTEYWSNIDVIAEFDAVVNTVYVESAYDNTLVSPIIHSDDGNDYTLATAQQFQSLLDAYNTLNTNYKTLRNELKAAGLLTNSQ